MNAGEYLLLKSSLATGTAAQHLLSPFFSGNGVIVNDGIYVELSTMQVTVDIEDSPLVVEIVDSPIEVELTSKEITVEIAS